MTGLESERDEAVAHSNIIVDDFRALNEQYVVRPTRMDLMCGRQAQRTRCLDAD